MFSSSVSSRSILDVRLVMVLESLNSCCGGGRGGGTEKKEKGIEREGERE